MTTLIRNDRDRRSGKPGMGHARKERVLLFGTRSADYIRASSQSGCIQRPNTWLHPNVSLNCPIFPLHRGRRPYMAHTSPSEGTCSDFENLTAPDYWWAVPGGLTVNFGHFGDTEIAPDNLSRALAYWKLMGRSGSPGANFYADAAYLTEALKEPVKLTEALRRIFTLDQAKTHPT